MFNAVLHPWVSLCTSHEEESEGAGVFHLVFLRFEVVASFESDVVATLVLWIVVRPFRSELDVIFGSLMAEQEHVITVEALDSFRCRDKRPKEMFLPAKLLWCIPTVDFPDLSA